MWQKNVLNRAVSNKNGADWGLVEDVTYKEGLDEGLLVVKNISNDRVLVIPPSAVDSVSGSLVIPEKAGFESYDEPNAEAIYARGLLNKAVVSVSGCDVGHVRNFAIDTESKELGLVVGVGIQAFHIEIIVPWSKIEAVDELIEVSDAAVLHSCLNPLY